MVLQLARLMQVWDPVFMVYCHMQAMQRAGLCGNHSPTRLLVLSPSTLSDVLESILQV